MIDSGEKNTIEKHRRVETYRLILAALFPLASLMIQWIYWDAIRPYAWFLFYPAVFFSAWLGGKKAGIFATIFSVLAVWWFFIPSRYSLQLENSTSAIAIGIFFCMGLLFSLMFDRLQKTNRQLTEALEIASTARNQLEKSVVERTAELEKTLEELRESEEKYKLIAENADDWITWVAPDGTPRYISPSCERVSGYSVKDFADTTAQLHLKIVHPEDKEKLLQHSEKAHKEKKNPDYLEYRIITKNGEIRWIGHFCSPMFNADGLYVGRAVRNQNITRRKQAEEELRRLNVGLEKKIEERTRELHDSQLALLNLVDDLNLSIRDTESAKEKLEKINKEIEAFSYSVSHDLRAPLRHVVGFSEILRETAVNLDEKSRHCLENIIDSTKRMGDLIDDLLSFSRMGRVEMQNTAVNTGKLIGDIIKDVSRETQGRDIAWEINPLPSITGDPAMLRLAFMNLIINAVKFTRFREHARIAVGSLPSENNETVFFVRDNGVGFDMKYVDKLFGVFQRLHSRTEFEGTGIGLANVKRIVERHGGQIWAEGVVDSGAIFYVSLPKEKGE